MNRFVLSGLAFAMALGTAQAAEPLTLSAEQMDQVTASGNRASFVLGRLGANIAARIVEQGAPTAGRSELGAELTRARTLTSDEAGAL